MDQQSLNSLLQTQSTQAQNQSDQLNTLMNTLGPQLQTFLLIGTLFSVAITLLLLINAIYKWRVERAILRMDKNLRKLVEAQVPEQIPAEDTPN